MLGRGGRLEYPRGADLYPFCAVTGGVSGAIDGECAGPIASKLAPTGISVERKTCVQPITLWERACSGRRSDDGARPDNKKPEGLSADA
ncbi:hypothetical protein D3C85_1655390 [compost metagenome]